MTELNATALIADVRTLAAENPEKTAVCVYVRREPVGLNESAVRPVCIMGHALVRAGIDAETLQVGRGIAAFFKNADVVSRLGYTIAGEPTEQELDWLSRVQYYQDRGRSWAEAVYIADKMTA